MGGELAEGYSLEIFYDYFSARIGERRREPLSDVLTGMAMARFPDGTLPDPIEVARHADLRGTTRALRNDRQDGYPETA